MCPPFHSPSGLEQRVLGELPRVRRLLVHLLGGERAEVDDLVQEVWLRARRYRRSFDPGGSLGGWLSRTALRVFLDHRAGALRRPRELGDGDRALVGARGDVAAVRDEVAFFLGGLAEVERDVLVRFHGQRQSIREIARDLAMPAGTVKSHLHRARRKVAARGRLP